MNRVALKVDINQPTGFSDTTTRQLAEPAS